MKLLGLNLRGSIGVRKGMGLEEIEIDFTQFGPGLIAITGITGRGKSTIMDNSQPFRELPSKPGTLEEHFELKDSYRVLRFTPGGENIFETKLLIDGLTKKSEAYLYKNGIALNDGLKLSYDREVIKLFGSSKLFFNSVFAAQKTKGIFSLKEGESRELFYEILDINNYTPKEDNAKKYLQNEKNKLEVLENEIKVFTAEMTGCKTSKEDIESKIYAREELASSKMKCEEKINEYRGGIENLNGVIAGLSIKIEQQQEINDRITELTEEIEFHKEKKELELVEIDGQRDAGLNTFESSNEFDKHIKELETKEDFLTGEADREKEEINSSIVVLNNEINANDLKKVQIEAKITRSKTILENKGTIAINLDGKKKWTEEAAKLLAEEKEHLLEIGKLQEGKEVEEKLLQALRESYSNTDKIKSQKDHQLSTIKELITSLEQLKKIGLDRLREEISTIDKVPCNEVIGRDCMFLTRAMESKDTLKDVEDDYDNKIGSKDKERIAILLQLEGTKKFLTEADEEIKAKEEFIQNNFTSKIEAINTLVIALKEKVKEAAGKLAELAKTNWDALDKELAEAEKNDELWQSEIKNLDKANGDKRKQKNDLQERLVNIQDRLNNNLQDVENQILKHGELLEKERKAIINFYTEKKNSTFTKYEMQNEGLKKELAANLVKIDTTLEIQKNEKEVMLKNSRTELEAEENWLKETETKLTDMQIEIADLNNKLIKKQYLTDTIELKNGERLFVEEEIKQWGIIREAMSKTGIPVLKLEISGSEVSRLTNESLRNYDNKFRIVFETTKYTKDKKKQIEIFKTNVIDEDGICDVLNKSGGQKTEIETAMQLAIAHFKRSQGQVKVDTGYLDEGDGSLDVESAGNYFKVIEEAHKRSGVYNTIVITHRPELIEQIPQRIELHDGYFEIIRN